MISDSINRQSMKHLSLVLPLLLVSSLDAFPVVVPWQLPNVSFLQPPEWFSPSAFSGAVSDTAPATPAQKQQRAASEAELQDQMRELLNTDFVRRRGQDEEDELAQANLPNLYRAQTVQDCKKILADGDDKLTVVHFSAPFCLACKAVSPLFHKLARNSPDVNFVLLTVTKDNRHDVRDWGIPSLPYGYVHHPTHGVVEELSTNKRHFADFTRVVESYQALACELPSEVDSESHVFASPFARVQ